MELWVYDIPLGYRTHDEGCIEQKDEQQQRPTDWQTAERTLRIRIPLPWSKQAKHILPPCDHPVEGCVWTQQRAAAATAASSSSSSERASYWPDRLQRKLNKADPLLRGASKHTRALIDLLHHIPAIYPVTHSEASSYIYNLRRRERFDCEAGAAVVALSDKHGSRFYGYGYHDRRGALSAGRYCSAANK